MSWEEVAIKEYIAETSRRIGKLDQELFDLRRQNEVLLKAVEAAEIMFNETYIANEKYKGNFHSEPPESIFSLALAQVRGGK